MRLESFKAEHIDLFAGDFGPQEWLAPYLELGAMIESRAYSVFDDPHFLGSFGLHPVHAYRGVVWALIKPSNPVNFLKFHRCAARVLAGWKEDYRRIEAYVDPDFPAAVRWIKLLGFRVECELKPYFFPDGRPASEWVLLRA